MAETLRGQANASSYPTDAERWDAVRNRDIRADGAFYYSVRSTGVYCRPSCAARQPRRENVRFHASSKDAEASGFRPCKRCRPDEAPSGAYAIEIIAQACRRIETAGVALSLDDLALAAGMSRYHFHRLFKAHTGVTPHAYVKAHRMLRAREEMLNGPTITEAIYNAGFSSSGPFYAAASDWLGMTPTEFRNGGSGRFIRFAITGCWLGKVLVACTERGVCAILFGEDPEELLGDLHRHFPRATLAEGGSSFQDVVNQVVRFVEAPTIGLDLPLDVRGTAFQHRVWQALLQIPSGETATYGEIARRVGRPKAQRAVAQACAGNPIAVAIPCHRIVRSDGAVAGYRWGSWRKQRLLERESHGGDGP